MSKDIHGAQVNRALVKVLSNLLISIEILRYSEAGILVSVHQSNTRLFIIYMHRTPVRIHTTFSLNINLSCLPWKQAGIK